LQAHGRWASDIAKSQGVAPNYPIIGDPDLAVAKLYNMLLPNVSGDAAKRTAADNQTVRNVFVVGRRGHEPEAWSAGKDLLCSSSMEIRKALEHVMTGLIDAFCVRDRDQAIRAPSLHQLMLGHDEMNVFGVKAIGHVHGGRDAPEDANWEGSSGEIELDPTRLIG
jgi:hypothetical protein